VCLGRCYDSKNSIGSLANDKCLPMLRTMLTRRSYQVCTAVTADDEPGRVVWRAPVNITICGPGQGSSEGREGHEVGTTEKRAQPHASDVDACR
jgi:hypothetical protein